MGSSVSVSSSSNPRDSDASSISDSFNGTQDSHGSVKSVLTNNLQLSVRNQLFQHECMNFMAGKGKLPYVRCFQDLEKVRKNIIQLSQRTSSSTDSQRSYHTQKILVVPKVEKYIPINLYADLDPEDVTHDWTEISKHLRNCLFPLHHCVVQLQLKQTNSPDIMDSHPFVNDSGDRSNSNSSNVPEFFCDTFPLDSNSRQSISSTGFSGEIDTDMIFPASPQYLEKFYVVENVRSIDTRWLQRVGQCQKMLLSHVMQEFEEFITMQSSSSRETAMTSPLPIEVEQPGMN